MARAATLRHLLGLWDGDIAPATNLEREIEDLDESALTMMVDRLTEAASKDFGDLCSLLSAISNQTDEEALRLARRLGWTIRALTDWDTRRDKSRFQIEGALAAAARWDCAGSFWEAARPHLEGRRTLMPALEYVINARAVKPEIPANTPVWEREHLQGLLAAEQAGDWAQLGERAQAFKQLPCPDVCAGQAILALAALDWPRLVRLADKTDGWFRGHLLLRPLPLVDALRLAAASRSGHFQFAALERVLRREGRQLSAQEETALRNLLVVLAKDKDAWQSWLAFCNKYPVRYPQIQGALGRTLARSDESALAAYVDSISISASDSGMRDCVTYCLATFRARAGAGRRRALWRRAFDRWQDWDFGANEDQGLNAVAQSALDYGVVGWVVEGEPQGSFTDLDRSFQERLRTLDMQWHSSLSSAVSSFLRLVSRYQVFSHAYSQSAASPDWLPGPAVRVPAAAADNFVQQRYRWNGS